MTLWIGVCTLLLATPQDAVELRWKFRPGQVLRYEVTQKTTSRAPGVEQVQDMTTIYRWTVKEVADDGTADIQLTFEALAIRVTGPQNLEYDSRKDKELPAHPALASRAKIVGQSLSLKMSALGGVKEVLGLDKIVDAIVEGYPEGQREVWRGVLSELMSSDWVKSLLEQTTPSLPEQKVAPGDTWKNAFKFPMPMMGNMTFATNGRLSEVRSGKAKIEVKFGLEREKEDEKELPGGIQIVDASGTVTAVFSLEDGLYESSRTVMNQENKVGGSTQSTKTVGEMKLLRSEKDF